MTRQQAEAIDLELRTGRVRPFTSVSVQRLTGEDWCVSLTHVRSRGGEDRERRWLVRTMEEWQQKRPIMRYMRLSGEPRPEEFVP